MSPSKFHKKLSTRSEGGHDLNNDNCLTSKASSDESGSDEESKVSKRKGDGINIVKSFLGPSFEDAFLRTFELGKSFLAQKSYDNEDALFKEKKHSRKKLMNDKKFTLPVPALNIRPNLKEIEGKKREILSSNVSSYEGRCTKKRIIFTAKLDKELPLFRKNSFNKKSSTLFKIRSLDSDLKQVSSSPEKIKKQLEALIQINKDEPPERATNKLDFEIPEYHTEMTVMPSFIIPKSG